MEYAKNENENSLLIKIGSYCIVSLLISWNMPKKIKIKSSLLIGSYCIGFLSTPLWGGDLLSFCGVEYGKNENEKSLLIKIELAFYPLLSGEDISSHHVALNMAKMRMKSPF